MRIDGCNADIQLLEAYYALNDGDSYSDIPCSVKLRINVADLEFSKVACLSQLTAKGITAFCPHVEVYGREQRRTFHSTICAALHAGLEDGSIRRGYFLDHTGAIRFSDGHVCFLRGTELIGECNRPFLCAPELPHYQLLGSGDLNRIQFLSILQNTAPQALLVIAFVILASVRSLLVESGVDFQAVLYIVGKQGIGKTTLAKRIAGIYERDGRTVGMVQAGTTHAAANEIMAILQDQTLIVDDICLSASRNTIRKRVDLVSTLIRQASGDISICKKQGKSIVELPCNTSLIFTAEFSLKNLSDLTRCIIVPVRERLDIPDVLTPTLMGDVVRFYSRWFCKHTDKGIAQYRPKDSIGMKLEPRIRNNYGLLRAAMCSLLGALCEGDIPLSLGNAVLDKFDAACTSAIREHESMIQALKMQEPIGNLAYCLYMGYLNQTQGEGTAFNLAEKISKLSKHGGIFWKGDLCLRSDELLSYVNRQPGYQNWKIHRIVQELNRIQALVFQNDGTYTVKLDKSSPVRVYRIRPDALQGAMKKY